MALLSLAALTLILGYAAISRAGVPPNEWNSSLIATALVCFVYFLSPKRRSVARVDRLSLGLALAFLSLALLQLLPLPLSLTSWLSPTRGALARAAAEYARTNALQATITAVPLATTQYAVTLCGYLLVFLIVRDISLRVQEHPWATASPLLAIAALEALLGLYQARADGGPGIASGTYDNRDHFAGLIEIALPFCVMYAIAVLDRDRSRFTSRAASGFKSCALLSIAAVMMVAIIYSLSRMGFLVTLSSLILCGSLALYSRFSQFDHGHHHLVLKRILAALFIAVVLGLAFVYLPTDTLISRFADFAKTEAISADDRAQIWRDTWNLIQAYPITGCGLGAYGSCFYQFKTVAPMFTVDYAHNDYLQVIAELGIVGFLIGLAFVARVLTFTVRGVLRADTVDGRYLLIACLGSMCAMLLHSFVDFNMYVPANGYAFAWVLGIAGVNLRRKPGAGVR